MDKGSYHGDPKKNFEFEWDVQLSKKGMKEWGNIQRMRKNILTLLQMTQFHTNIF